jgi:hypothetical protein
MVEFALTLPILLFMTMGIIDFGRVLITFAQTSASVRNALRYGVILGDETAGPPNYLDCPQIHSIAGSLLFANPPTVTVWYEKAADTNGLTAGDTVACTTDIDTVNERADLDTKLSNGDILHVRVVTNVDLMTPLFGFSLPIDMGGQRTLVKSVQLAWDPGGSMGPDTDYGGVGDGIPDEWENTYFPTYPVDSVFPTADPDADGCDNYCEYINYTHPLQPDSDGDSLNDGPEVYTHFTDPIVADTDDDGLDDGVEVNVETTDPLDEDTDGDGLIDGYEVNVAGSDPKDPLDPSLPEVSNLALLPNLVGPLDPGPGSECNALASGDRFIGLSWDAVAAVDGYYIYVEGFGAPVGQVSAELCGGPPGPPGDCFNLNPGAWDPEHPLTYRVAAFTGPVIGAISQPFTYLCSPGAPLPNQYPNAVDDTATTTKNVSVNINVLANDIDPEGDPLTIISFTQPSKGTVSNVGGGILMFQPKPGSTGVFSFSYTISDGEGGTDNAIVTVTVNP